MDKLSLRSLN